MKAPTPTQATPRLYPISFLPAFDDAITGAAESVRDQLRNLALARDRRGFIEPAELIRMQRVYSDSTKYAQLYREQLHRWRGEAVTPEQFAALDRLDGVVRQWIADAGAVLESVKALKA